MSSARLINIEAPGEAPGRVLWFLTAVWCAAIPAAPLFGLDAVYSAFSLICHQIPDRSWHVAGHPLPVCIRCAAIYAGFLVALTVRLPSTSAFLRIALALMVLEFVTARVWIDFEPARAATGLVFGLAAAGFVDAGTRELCSRPGRRRRQAAMVGNVE